MINKILTLLAVLSLCVLANGLLGIGYESYLLRKNSEGFREDIRSLIENPEKELNCVNLYNPFRWWKSYEEQTRNITRRCPK